MKAAAAPWSARLPAPASTTTTALDLLTRSGKYFSMIWPAAKLGEEPGRKARWSVTATLSMLGAVRVSTIAATIQTAMMSQRKRVAK